MSPNVLVLFTSNEIGGAERSLFRMANSPQVKIRYCLATLGGQGALSLWAKSQNVDFQVFGKNNKANSGKISFGALVRMFVFARQKNIQFIYVIGFRASVYVRLINAMLLFRYKVYQGVRWNPASKSLLDVSFRVLEKYLTVFTAGYITNSQAALDTLLAVGIKKSKTTVIRNGLTKFPEFVNSFESRKDRILIVANLNPRKGYAEALDALEIVLNEFPHYEVVIAGRDDMGGVLQKKVEAKGLSRSIRFCGFVEDISKEMRMAKVFFLPSQYGEGCPTSVMEAMAHGLPVVAYDTDGVSELVLNKKTGLLVSDIPDAKAIAEKISLLLTVPDTWKQYSEEARVQAIGQFPMRRCVELHDECWES